MLEEGRTIRVMLGGMKKLKGPQALRAQLTFGLEGCVKVSMISMHGWKCIPVKVTVSC